MESKRYPHPTPPPSYDQQMMQNSNQDINQHQQQQQHLQHHHQQQQQRHHQHQQANVYPIQHQMPPPIVTEQVHVVMAPQVGPDPTMITCPSCRATVITRMEFEPSTKTHIIAGLLCFFCLWCCICIPYCVDSCKNGNHYCPSCGAYIGSYSN